MSKVNLLSWVACVSLATTSFAQTAGTDIKGSPYTSENYTNATIYFANTTRNQNLAVRYNAYQDLLEYQQNGQRLVLDANAAIKKVDCGESTIVVEKYKFRGKPKTGYLTVLDTGKATLYVKHTVIFIEAKKGGNLDGTDQPAQFKRSPDTYYYRVGDGPLTEVDNMKSVIASFPDKQDELAKYVKKEKITHRKEEQLRQFFKYYNTL
jgi:hypothetical protein